MFLGVRAARLVARPQFSQRAGLHVCLSFSPLLCRPFLLPALSAQSCATSCRLYSWVFGGGKTKEAKRVTSRFSFPSLERLADTPVRAQATLPRQRARVSPTSVLKLGSRNERTNKRAHSVLGRERKNERATSRRELSRFTNGKIRIIGITDAHNGTCGCTENTDRIRLHACTRETYKTRKHHLDPALDRLQKIVFVKYILPAMMSSFDRETKPSRTLFCLTTFVWT